MNVDKNSIFQELIKNQRKNVLPDKKLQLTDLKRMSTYLKNSIFTDECSIWGGYITQFKNNSFYINFFFNGKKQALHRLIYINFIDNIKDSEYLKYTCENKGKCCCINHLKKASNDDCKENDSSKQSNTNTEDYQSDDSKDSKIKKKITVEF